MKVSEWLRKYQLTGQIPDTPDGVDPNIAYWCGWLMGNSSRVQRTERLSDPHNLEQAIAAAEFIEAHAKG